MGYFDRGYRNGQKVSSFDFFEAARDFSDTFKGNVLAIYGTGEKTLRQVRASRSDPIELDFPSDKDCPKSGDGTVPAISAYAEGIYQVGVTKEKVGDWELDLGKLAGFHASFCAYDLVQDLVISFLSGKVIKTVKKEFSEEFLEKYRIEKLEGIEDFPKFTVDRIKELDPQ